MGMELFLSRLKRVNSVSLIQSIWIVAAIAISVEQSVALAEHDPTQPSDDVVSYFPEERLNSLPGVASAGSWELQGLKSDATHGIAIVGGQWVSLGGEYLGYTLAKISPTQAVFVNKSGNKKTLVLEVKSFQTAHKPAPEMALKGAKGGVMPQPTVKKQAKKPAKNKKLKAKNFKGKNLKAKQNKTKTMMDSKAAKPKVVKPIDNKSKATKANLQHKEMTAKETVLQTKPMKELTPVSPSTADKAMLSTQVEGLKNVEQLALPKQKESEKVQAPEKMNETEKMGSQLANPTSMKKLDEDAKAGLLKQFDSAVQPETDATSINNKKYPQSKDSQSLVQ